jgi:hypothetical protein
MRDTRTGRTIRLTLLAAMIGLVAACGGSAAATPSSSAPGVQPAASTGPAPGGGEASTDPGGGTGGDLGASTDNGPIGGDIGDRSKGSAQATVSGGYSATIDLPYGALLGNLLINGPNTAYLPFTDETHGTLFLTIADGNQLLVQYAGPDNVGITNGGTPCDLKVDALDASQAKGSFTCKGMMVIQGESIGSADMSGTFEAHR